MTEPSNSSPPPAIPPTTAANQRSLPTLTPTPAATSAPTQVSTPTTDIPAATPEPSSSDWSFANAQLYPNQYGDGLLLYGEVINNSNSAQEVVSVTGTFFDAQGQPVADAEDTIDYWPIDIVPPGGRLPFELTVFGIDNAANFDLKIEAQASDRTPHQNFEFANVSELPEEGNYCLVGELQNLGAPLQTYVVIMAELYDSQDQMLKFGDYYESDFGEAAGDQSLPFEICAELFDQNVARYELRAWGE